MSSAAKVSCFRIILVNTNNNARRECPNVTEALKIIEATEIELKNEQTKISVESGEHLVSV